MNATQAPSPLPATPIFDAAAAIAVDPPRRHGFTARTIGYVQPTLDPETAHLFSPTGDYICSLSRADADAFLPAAPLPDGAAFLAS